MSSHNVEDDDDDFVEYNPHPYKGGYDIALTYGSPLSPSPSTCYPISDHKPHTSPPPEFDHRPLPDSGESGHPPGDYSPPPPPESDHRPLPDSGESGHPPEDYSPPPPPPSVDVFGGGLWPSFLNCGEVEDDAGYWRQLRRAGEYLFGYSEGYGERRIGVDSYGIPIYANKREPTQPLTLQIEPAAAWDRKVDCFEGESWSLSYDEKKEKSYGYNHNNHYYEEPLYVQEIMIEPMLHQRLTYHKGCEEKVNPQQEISSSYGNESNFYGNSQCAYERHYYEQPLSIELEPYKSTWSENLSYQEFYGGAAPPESNWWSTSYDEKKEKSYDYDHNIHYYKEPLFVQDFMIEPMLHQRLTYHKSHEEKVYTEQELSYVYGDESNSYGNSQSSYERHYNEQPLCVELEPYKPTMHENLSYQEFYGGAASLESNWNSSADKEIGDVSSIFMYPNYAYESYNYEQPSCDQLEPFKSSWSQNPTLYEPCMQEFSEPSWVDESFKEYGAQYLNPFTNYSEYDE